MSVFEKVAFKAPNYSVFDLSHDNKISYNVGDVLDAMRVDVAPGERFRVSVEQLTRFAPMLAPTMHNFRLYVDSVFVPYRILGKDWDDCFNFAKDESSHPIPSFDYKSIAPITATSKLFDSLNYPTFDKLKEFVLSKLNSSSVAPYTQYKYYNPGDSTSDSPRSSGSMSYLNWLSIPVNALENEILLKTLAGTGYVDVTADAVFMPFFMLEGRFASSRVFNNYDTPSIEDFISNYVVGTEHYVISLAPIPSFWRWFVRTKCEDTSGYTSVLNNGSDPFGYLLDKNSLTADSVIAEYINYVVSLVFSGRVVRENDDPTEQGVPFFGEYLVALDPESSSTLPINMLEFLTYWKAIFDWYINTNIDGDPDDLWNDFLTALNNNDISDYAKPFVRRWASDYFTSCFPDGTVPAVPIPADATIPDLRNTNRLQKLEERILYAGKRSQDQNLAQFGVVSSNARFDRTEVLSRRVFDIDINAITQTNQAELNKALRTPLASYAGQGISVDLGQFLFDYTAEERGMIHVFISIRPQASYFQGLPKQYTKVSRYDFLTPLLADVGESIVKRSELYFDMGTENNTDVFGYNRQYSEYMFLPSETHGAFRNSLRHWTAARFIDKDRARLDSDFIGVDPSKSGDDINRVFASDGDDTCFTYMYFHISAVRPLSRTINYSL